MSTIINEITTTTQESKDIVWLIFTYMGLYDKQYDYIAFSESGIASYVVSMLSDKDIMSITDSDVFTASNYIVGFEQGKYSFIDADLLSKEIMNRIVTRRDNKYQNPKSHEILSRVFIGVSVYFIYHLFIRK